MNIFGILQEQAAAIASLARAEFERDHPTAAASLGTALDGIFARAVDAFLDVYITGDTDTWDACV
jgi:hypothetical protein